jgi:hypothetical protein
MSRRIEKSCDGYRLRLGAICALAIVVLVVTIRLGAFVAGGADSSGYLSQARLWERGSVITHDSVSQKVDWLYADWTFSPLGYRPGVQKGTLVPIYSVGYPMVMGLVRQVFGAGSEMYVVPIAAAGLVVCTAIIGTWIGGFLVGSAASLLLATSPPFVLQSLQPMSDVPTAFWWSLAAVLGRGRSLLYSATSAVAVMIAILTRPNLAPLALPLVLLVLAGRADGRSDERSYNWTGGIIILIASALAAALVAYLNTIFYGGPGVSGYGAARDLYQLGFGPINLVRYTRWLIQTETVLIVAALAGVLVMAVRNVRPTRWGIFTAAVFTIVLLSYLFYRPFDNWTYLRFFLPAYPFLFVALVTLANVSAFGSKPGLRRAFVVIVTLVIVSAHVKFILDNEVLKTKAKEEKYLEVTDYVQRSLPTNAIFIGHQYTGSLRYYTDRAILRYDWLEPDRLEHAVATLEGLGYKPYFLLEDWEEPIFRDRFVAYSRLAKLDWYPSVEFRTNHVRIYDPAKRPDN